MSERARDAVLARLRQALGRSGPAADEARRAALARLADPPPGIIPQRADLPLDERVALFTAQAEAVQTTVRRIGHVADVPDAVTDFLREHNLPMQLVMADDPLLDGAAWRSSMIEVRRGRPEDNDEVGLTTAFAGIAETGTLMLVSDAAHPTMLAFLPDTSIVALPTRRVLRAYEDAWRVLRQERRELPRSVNLITGPSRTADIEQTLQLGAHGPLRLMVLLVDEAPAASR